VRRHAGTSERVANNPLFLADLTPWPINLSWALLSQRNSCFAGADTALPFVPLPHARRDAIDAQFIRVFDGTGSPQDVAEMATTYGCAVVVVTVEDKAWNADPFAGHPSYRLVESKDGQWRIYRAVTDGATR
jgi:hypothetical protein